jgi:hypothetical protein
LAVEVGLVLTALPELQQKVVMGALELLYQLQERL